MQASFSDLEYVVKKQVPRCDWSLSEIDAMTPWSALIPEIEAFYSKGVGRGRPHVDVQQRLRIYIAHHCFGLSDEGIEDATYGSQAIRGVIGIDLDRETAPNATSLPKFRRLLGTKKLTERMFIDICQILAANGLLLWEGALMDATIIESPSSTRNKNGARGPDIHQTEKGSQSHFELNARIGVVAESRLTHTLRTTSANVSDITQAYALLHGDGSAASGDACYHRQENQSRSVKRRVALSPGKLHALLDTKIRRLREQLEKLKAIIRAKVAHPFHVVENIFGNKRAHYRGQAENTVQLHTLFGLANLMIAKRRLFELHAQGAS